MSTVRIQNFGARARPRTWYPRFQRVSTSAQRTVLCSRGAHATCAGARSASTPSVLDPLSNLDHCTLPCGLVDFYALLQVDQEAPPAEIKAAYRSMQKVCHPDILGDEMGHKLCIVLNEAYTVLVNPRTRSLYDVDLQESRWEQEKGMFTNEAISEWVPASRPPEAKNADPAEARAVFVDECTCIGCKQCVWNAPNTFAIDDLYGRSRARRQWADNEDDLQTAIDSCPVDCIHWVQRDELPVLEHVMARMPRTDVGIMMSGNTGAGDVFEQAASFQKHENQRRSAHASWKKAYEYTQEQEEAMHNASVSSFAAHFSFASKNLGFLGTVMARIMQAFQFVKHRSDSSQARQEASIPLKRALVPIRK